MKQRQRRLSGLDDRVLSRYARGLSTREIQGHLEERYGTEVSPTLISPVTKAVLEEIKAWQNRPRAVRDPILYLDARIVNSREAGTVGNRAV